MDEAHALDRRDDGRRRPYAHEDSALPFRPNPVRSLSLAALALLAPATASALDMPVA